MKIRQLTALGDAILKRLAEIDSTLLAHDAALRDIYEKLLPFVDTPMSEDAPPSRDRISRSKPGRTTEPSALRSQNATLKNRIARMSEFQPEKDEAFRP